MATYNARFSIDRDKGLNDATVRDIQNTLLSYGPYLCEDEDGTYLAYSDTGFLMNDFQEIDPVNSGYYTRSLHYAWEHNLDEEAALAETIMTLRHIGLTDDEIADLFLMAPEYYDVSPGILNGRLEHCPYCNSYFYMPEF